MIKSVLFIFSLHFVVASMKSCHHRTECDGFCQVGTQLCQWGYCACGRCTHQACHYVADCLTCSGGHSGHCIDHCCHCSIV